MIDSRQIEEVKRTIVERFRPRRVVLFGSYARGTPGRDSDLDLFVEMETTASPPQRAIQVSEAFGLRTWPLDIVVYTPDEVRRLRGRPGTMLAEIESEGKVLYEQR